MPESSSALPLNASTVDALFHADAPVGLPLYDRAAIRPSIVHIGVGGFHRAHLATYVDELCRLGHTNWAIVGSGTRPDDATMAAVLADQDHLYSLIVRDADTTSVRIIGSLVDYVHAHPDSNALLDRIAHPDTQIVSLTVTEGGYPIDDTTGHYDPASPSAGPGSAFAIIAAGLEKRRQDDGGPLTILSCDNIMSNGAATEQATLGEAQQYGLPLLEWIRSSVSFPNSMVDRITPATTDQDRAWLEAECHLVDRWPVVTEPFRQWVIEDRFAGARPPLEVLDVIVTDDVEPYELMKLRLLNAGHSCLAYPAALLGIEHVHTAMADADVRRFVLTLLKAEAAPALPDVPGIDIEAYIASLIERFSNPAIGDQIARLCQDGSAKFPKFLLPTVRTQLEMNGPIERSVFALAAWCEYLSKSIGPDATIEAAMDSGLADAQARAAASIGQPDAFLDFPAVFPADLAGNRRFVEVFSRSLEAIRSEGLRSAFSNVVEGRWGQHDGAPS